MRQVVSLIVLLGSLSIGIASSSASTDCPQGVYTVNLLSPGAMKLNVVKTVKLKLGLGLAESKALVDAAPGPVAEGMTLSAANALKAALQDAGAEASVDGPYGCSGDTGTTPTDPSGCPGGMYTVNLLSPGAMKLNVVKVVKAKLELGLAESKALVDAAPVTVLEGVEYPEAVSLQIALENAGAEVQRGGPFGCPEGSSGSPACPQGVYTVNLHSYGPMKLNVVKTVKAKLGLGLAESKALVDAAPGPVAEGMTLSAANALKAAMEDAGAEVSLDGPYGCSGDTGTTPTDPSGCPGGMYSVNLLSPGAMKLNVVKVVKAKLGLGLAESKALVDAAPCPVLEGATYPAAISLKVALENMGAEINVEGPYGCSGGTATTPTDPLGCPGGTYFVKLLNYGGMKLNVVKTVKLKLGLGLAESKALVDAAPVIVAAGITYPEAISLGSALEEAGAEVAREGPFGCSSNSGNTSAQDCSKARYRVRFLSHGKSRTRSIRMVKRLTGLSTRESRKLVGSAPVTLERVLRRSEAREWKSALEDAGAEVEIKKSQKCKKKTQ